MSGQTRKREKLSAFRDEPAVGHKPAAMARNYCIRAIQERREEIPRVAARHGGGNVRLFGSAARGTPDIDLLVDLIGVTSSWFPASLAAELEELLGSRSRW